MKWKALYKITGMLVIPLLLTGFYTLPEKANFTGEWALNESKSDLGQFANFATRSIKTEQKEDAIIISRTAPSFDGGEMTNTETLTFDGKESESSVFGNSKKMATLKWADDDQTFTVTFKLLLDFNGQTNEVNGTEKWSLTDEGKTLVLESHSSSNFGDNDTRSVFEKK